MCSFAQLLTLIKFFFKIFAQGWFYAEGLDVSLRRRALRNLKNGE